MAFEPKPNTGTFWTNDRKTAANQPDWKGDIFVDVGLLKDLMAKAENNMVKIAIAGWGKQIANKNAISMSVSAPYVKPAEDEVPY